MKQNFWKKLNKPFFALAPLDEVTDTVFRQMISSLAKPDVLFTEFTSAEGLLSKGADKVMRRLKFDKSERPVVAQIWALTPENMKKAAKIVADLGFDGVDINMGCPIRSVIARGTCSALIKNPELAKEMILAAREGAGDLPVSVKTRLGFSKIQMDDWIAFLLELNLPALTIHGRTVKEMSKVPAHWDEIGKVVKLRDQMGLETLIIGNGDVMSRSDGEAKAEEFKVDGIMVGRGIFHDPWIFSESDKRPSEREKLEVLLRHAKFFDDIWGDTKNFVSLRKYFKAYVNGFNGAVDLRVKLMESTSYEEVKAIVDPYLKSQDFAF